MNTILSLVGLLALVANVVAIGTHISVIYFAYSQVSAWWGVALTVVGLTFADLYWAYQWWPSTFAVFILLTSAAFLVLRFVGGFLEAAVGEVD